jgi:HEAT repeat protein
MKQLVVLSMLKQQSPSERLDAVSMSRQSGPDPRVLEALLHTLRYDNSVDVRLAALDALSHYGGRPDVRKGLIDALEGQQSPLVQVALIDALVDIHDSGAIQQLKKLQQDPRVDPSVRKHAEWGAAQLS